MAPGEKRWIATYQRNKETIKRRNLERYYKKTGRSFPPPPKPPPVPPPIDETIKQVQELIDELATILGRKN